MMTADSATLALLLLMAGMGVVLVALQVLRTRSLALASSRSTGSATGQRDAPPIRGEAKQTLQEACRKLDTAVECGKALTVASERIPELDMIAPALLEEFLQSVKLKESEKAAIRSADDKTLLYSKLGVRDYVVDAKAACVDLRDHVERHARAWPTDVAENLRKLSDLLWTYVQLKELGRGVETGAIDVKAAQQVTAEIEPLYQSIQAQACAHGIAFGSAAVARS
ncbi:MAG TPA: hypothetical protein VNE58_13820 [Casimicrobiaceae bacterium]|nr:hypothetical protein [Casimicrobiaceae bacterium]